MIELYDDDIESLLNKLSTNNENLAKSITKIHDARFDSLLDYTGRPYKPNSPAWIAVKKNNKPTTGLTGDMRKMFGSTHHSELVEIISNAPYSSDVQTERPFVGLLDVDLQNIIDLFYR